MAPPWKFEIFAAAWTPLLLNQSLEGGYPPPCPTIRRGWLAEVAFDCWARREAARCVSSVAECRFDPEPPTDDRLEPEPPTPAANRGDEQREFREEQRSIPS